MFLINKITYGLQYIYLYVLFWYLKQNIATFLDLYPIILLFSLLDNAPNSVVGCIIQKRITMLTMKSTTDQVAVTL